MMDVPCPVPLQNAWSPVGYRVIEQNTPPTQDLPSMGDSPPELPPVPSSPVGYRVVQVAGESSAPRPIRRPAVQPSASRAKPIPVRKKPPMLLWSTCAAGGAIVLVAMIVIIAMRMSDALPDPQQADAGPVVLPQVAVADRVVRPQPPAKADVLPPANKPAVPAPPAEPDEGPVNLAGIGAPEAAPPGAACDAGRQRFGTSVAFARNPQEANRQAVDEHKLVFILHVSGNFEEARFT
jgi:hypothetical protein